MAMENPRYWFKSIALQNIRSFGAKQTIRFTHRNGNVARWNVILGDNGTGKTTALRSLYVTAKNDYEIDQLIYDSYFLRYKNIEALTESSLEILSKKDTIIRKLDRSIELEPYDSRLTHRIEYSPFSFLKIDGQYQYNTKENIDIPIYGYGANRRIGVDPNLAIEAYTSNVNLFNDDAPLVDVEGWILKADYVAYKNERLRKRYDFIKQMILTLLRTEVSDLFIDTEFNLPAVYVITHYGKVKLRELSLGYKTLIAWMVDFARGLLERYPDSSDPLAEPAICLVDEIDLHLHPKFQRNIIQFLTDTFPNTQFIVTAHSPLIVQSAEDANIILLKREGDETHVAEGIDVRSWRVDQILSSDLFGEVSPRPPKTEEQMQRRRILLLKDNRSKEENQELEELEEKLGMLTASESSEALKALELISKALSK